MPSLSPVLAGLLLALLPMSTLQPAAAAMPPPVQISVGFGTTTSPTPVSHLGFTASEFGVEGGTVPTSTADQKTLRALGAGAVRIHLTPDGRGGVVGGAGGGDRSLTGDQWLDTYEAMGLAPTVVVNLDKADALAVQTYLRATGHDVRRYVLGNEMDANSKSDVGQDGYVARFAQVAAALRSSDPTLQVGGPAVACWDCLGRTFVQKLVALPRASRPSFVDWHEYGSGAGQPASMATSYRYGAEIATLRSWLPPDGSVGIQVGELNMNWGDEPGNNTVKQSVWNAAAIGTVLTSGATVFQYADKNGALGLTDAGRPKASYWGLGMFTGYGQFRRFGTSAVATSSSDSTVRVFASSGDRNVVVVNTSTTARPSRITLAGAGDITAQRWVLQRERPLRSPDVRVEDSRLSLWLPAMSVQTLVLSSPATGGV